MFLKICNDSLETGFMYQSPNSNNRLFAMQLFYDSDMTSSLSGGAQFSGNINGVKWRNYNNGSLVRKGYNYSYDGLNRLTKGDYGKYSGSWINESKFDLSQISYDTNGNIKNLTRKSSSGSNRENLTYTYSGNQLSSVVGTFKGAGISTKTFGYDQNGNTTTDNLRGLTVDYFDEINLPKKYAKGSQYTQYKYDTSGVKWQKTTNAAGASSINYYGNFIYQGGTLDKVLTSEGFYDAQSGVYHYYLKDHLGNNRITFHYSGSTAVVDQEVDYYPFGSMHTVAGTSVNKYLYNGKELNNEFFENYDYGARFYDAELGRWHVVDNKAEEYYPISTYTYTLNNPIIFIDPDGNQVYPVHGTWSGPETWGNLSALASATSLAFGDRNMGVPYEWSGGNHSSMRTEAAVGLVADILDQRKGLDASEPVTLVGHSHGGNVSIEAINLMVGMKEFDGVEINLITINTPVRDDYQLNESASERVKHINVFDPKDPVQNKGGNTTTVPSESGEYKKPTGEYGKAGREFNNAENIEVDNPQGATQDYHNSHNRIQNWFMYLYGL
ncbi:hypothetical protein EYV94_27560 [Puteibacter caeruleilacunae]|nr:hypothetical protein EYV94_27560 [Puteibacter caeruleilacunae]